VLITLARAGGCARKDRLGEICSAFDVPLEVVEKELVDSYLLRVARETGDYMLEQLAVDWVAAKHEYLDDDTRGRVERAQRSVEQVPAVHEDDGWSFRSDHERSAYRLSLAEAAARDWQLRRWQDADRRFREAISEDAANGALRERYASFLVDASRANDALARCDDAEAAGANEGEVRFTRARAFAAVGRFVDAAREVERASVAGKSAEECGTLRRRLIADEIRAALRDARNRNSEMLGALRQRAAEHLDAQLPEPAGDGSQDPGDKPPTPLVDRADAYAKSGEDPDLRDAAKLLRKLDEQLEALQSRHEKKPSPPR
jgi:tetratricopeptide (TPR) repeat protein